MDIPHIEKQGIKVHPQRKFSFLPSIILFLSLSLPSLPQPFAAWDKIISAELDVSFDRIDTVYGMGYCEKAGRMTCPFAGLVPPAAPAAAARPEPPLTRSACICASSRLACSMAAPGVMGCRPMLVMSALAAAASCD